MTKLLIILFLVSAKFAEAQTQSPDGTKVPPATQLTIPVAPPATVWTLGKPIPAFPGNREVLRNGKPATRDGGSLLVFCQQSVYLVAKDKTWKVIRDDNVSIQWESVPGKIPCDTPPSLPALTFTANPPTVAAGGSSTLTWNATNAAGCVAAGGWSGAKPASGSESVTPVDLNTTYTLACGNISGNITIARTGTPPGLCPAANTGGRFTVGDKLKIKAGTNGWQMRPTPDIDADYTPPGQTEGQEGIVDCVQAVPSAAGIQWVKVIFKAGTNGWAREICCDKVGPIVPPPPPPPDNPIEPPPTDATYYVSPVGDDANDGRTIKAPFKTLQFAIPKLKPGEVLVARGGFYETDELMLNGQSIIPSGESWERPVQIRAYPGETPIFRRFLPPGYDEAAVMASAHMASKAQCDSFMAARGQPNYSYPKDCWTGSGSDPSGLYIQLHTQSPLAFGAAVIKLQRTPTPGSLAYIIFDGITIDAMGMVGNAVSFPESPLCGNWRSDTCSGKHIRFIRSTIINSVASCFSQPGVGDDQQIDSDIQVIDSKVGKCGVPNDPNRSAYGSLLPFFHTFYQHSCAAMVINSELFSAAGTGVSLDCDRNIIRGNYIHDNNSHGVYVAGGHNWVVENNLLVNNGGAGITHYGGHGHIIRNNTIIQTIPNVAQYGVLLNVQSSDSLHENNLILGAPFGYYNLSQTAPRITVRNNLVWGATPGREFYEPSGVVSMIQSGNLIADPKLDSNYLPLPGSPALSTGIGARR